MPTTSKHSDSEYSLEKFFLKDPALHCGRELFEKESLDQDFILVKNCDKKPNKIVHLGK